MTSMIMIVMGIVHIMALTLEFNKYFLRPEKKVAYLKITVFRVSNPGNGMFFP
jgi:hypothetical protein